MDIQLEKDHEEDPGHPGETMARVSWECLGRGVCENRCPSLLAQAAVPAIRRKSVKYFVLLYCDNFDYSFF